MGWVRRVLERAGIEVRDNSDIEKDLAGLDRIATNKIVQLSLFSSMSDTELLGNIGKLVMHISLVGDYADFLGAAATHPAAGGKFRHLDTPQAVRAIQEIQIRLRAAEYEGRKILRKADVLRGAGGALAAVGKETADVRWARLDPVKDWAFQQRRDNPQGSRAQFIEDRLEAIRKMAKDAGETLSGDDDAVKATIGRWFRKEGIK